MNPIRRAAPIAQLLLILPAALFMIALIVRAWGPLQYEPAHTAQQIVMWYSDRMWTLWLLLTLLPLAVLGIGCIVLLSQWRDGTLQRPFPAGMLRHGTTAFVLVATLASAVILLVVGLHVLMN